MIPISRLSGLVFLVPVFPEYYFVTLSVHSKTFFLQVMCWNSGSNWIPSRHNWYTAFHRALIGSDLLFAEGNFSCSSQSYNKLVLGSLTFIFSIIWTLDYPDHHHHHHLSAAEQATTIFFQPQRSCANSDSLSWPIMSSVSPNRCWM